MSEAQPGKVVPNACAQILKLLSENLGALTGEVLALEPRNASAAGRAELERVVGSGKVGRIECKLEGPHSGPIDLLWPMNSFVTLTGAYRSDSEDEIRAARGEAECSADDLETFEELAMLMSASFSEAIQESFGDGYEVDLEGQSVDTLAAFRDGSSKDLLVPFDVIAGALPPTKAAFCIPLELAEAIEGQEIELEEGESFDDADDFEAAEIVGSLAAFVTGANTVRMLRKSCRRVGLTFEKRPKSEVPNPACYSNTVIVLEVGIGQARRFEWCRRLKAMSEGNQVLLLLREPTKVSVVRAYNAGADAILSLQSTEREVSAKLSAFLSERDEDMSAA